MSSDEEKQPLTYASAGVDITAGEDAVRRIKRHVQSTYRPEVIGPLFHRSPGFVSRVEDLAHYKLANRD